MMPQKFFYCHKLKVCLSKYTLHKSLHKLAEIAGYDDDDDDDDD